MNRVIINADDLGKNEVVNAAIGQALADGVISSSTIMANSQTWNEVHRIVDANPNASFGIHLNLTEGKALTDTAIFHRFNIVDDNNKFTKKVRDLADYPDEVLKAVYDEWDAQIRKISETEGIKLSHVDGHHHIHTFYPFRNVLVELLKQYGIRKVRSRYVFPRSKSSTVAHNVVGVILGSDAALFTLRKVKLGGAVYSAAEKTVWCKQIRKDFLTTDYFDSYEHFCRVALFLDPRANKTIELMCHPGHPNYTKEYADIKALALEKIMPFELVSYKDL